MTRLDATRPASDPASGPAPEGHNLPLDSVRGIAAVCVVLYHVQLSATFRAAFGPDGGGLGLFRQGWICVDLFFVLSGIVMAMTYARRGRPFAPRAFAVRRLARLYPLHLAVLAAWLPVRLVRWGVAWAGLAAGAAPGPDVNTAYAFLVQVVLLNAFGTLDAMSWNGPSWSISAEAFAYAAFALVLAGWGGRGGQARLALAFAALAGLSLAVALFVLREGGLDFNLRFGVVRCLYGFSIGVVALCAARALRGRGLGAGVGGGIAQGAALVAALAVVATVGDHPGIGYAAPPAFALLLGSLVVAPGAALGRVLSAAPLAWLGRRSYSIYMVHALVIVLAEYLCRGVGVTRAQALDAALHGALAPLAALAIVAAVLALSDLTYRAVEVPGGRWVRDRFARPRTLDPPARRGAAPADRLSTEERCAS